MTSKLCGVLIVALCMPFFLGCEDSKEVKAAKQLKKHAESRIQGFRDRIVELERELDQRIPVEIVAEKSLMPTDFLHEPVMRLDKMGFDTTGYIHASSLRIAPDRSVWLPKKTFVYAQPRYAQSSDPATVKIRVFEDGEIDIYLDEIAQGTKWDMEANDSIARNGNAWCVETLNNFPVDTKIDSAEPKSLADKTDIPFDYDEVFADYEKEK